MDKAILVRSDLETRGQIQSALSLARIPVSLVEVEYIPQLDEWQIFVATSLYDSKGPSEANSRVIKALQALGIYKDVPIRRVFVKSPNDPLIKSLEAEVKVLSEGAIHIVALNGNHEGPYSVIFAPFTGPGGRCPRGGSTAENNFVNSSKMPLVFRGVRRTMPSLKCVRGKAHPFFMFS